MSGIIPQKEFNVKFQKSNFRNGFEILARLIEFFTKAFFIDMKAANAVIFAVFFKDIVKNPLFWIALSIITQRAEHIARGFIMRLFVEYSPYKRTQSRAQNKAKHLFLQAVLWWK